MSRLQKKPPAHKRGHPTIQNRNFFLLLWVIFALLDPDPDSNYGSGSGSNGPTEYGYNTDPDPKPCKHLHLNKCSSFAVFLQLSEYTNTYILYYGHSRITSKMGPTHKKQERGRRWRTVIQPIKKATLPAEAPDQWASYKLASMCRQCSEIHSVPKVSHVDHGGWSL